jgi:U6 snRNA-associated Sm-like protein LSm7
MNQNRNSYNHQQRGGGGSNGGGGGGGGGSRQQDRGAPVIDLEKLIEKRIRIRFSGGREVVGTLKGFDGLVNAVLDDTTEYLFESTTDSASLFDTLSTTTTTTTTSATIPTSRYLGLVVCRGTNITVIGPDDGFLEISNPFVDEEVDETTEGSGGQ